MPKLKTHKATVKRIRQTGGKKKKLRRRSAGQDHFNSRETSNKKRNKRSDFTPASNAAAKTLKKLTPYR